MDELKRIIWDVGTRIRDGLIQQSPTGLDLNPTIHSGLKSVVRSENEGDSIRGRGVFLHIHASQTQTS